MLPTLKFGKLLFLSVIFTKVLPDKSLPLTFSTAIKNLVLPFDPLSGIDTILPSISTFAGAIPARLSELSIRKNALKNPK